MRRALKSNGLPSVLCDSSQIHETIETINQLKTQREFMLSFARDPQGFINDWLQSQCRDLKVSFYPNLTQYHKVALLFFFNLL